MEFMSLWEEAGHSVEAEKAQRALAQAKVASASVWPFLALAKDEAEFGQRLDLAGETLSTAAGAHGVEVADLVTVYTREYGLLAESRKTADSHSECPNHPDQSYNKSTGDCSCGSNHNRWANSNNPGGQKSSGKLPDALKEHQFSKRDDDDDIDEGSEGGDDDGPERRQGSRTAGVCKGTYVAGTPTNEGGYGYEDKSGKVGKSVNECGKEEGHEGECGYGQSWNHSGPTASRRTADSNSNLAPEGYHYPENDDQDERTSSERWGEMDGNAEEPGDAQDRHYDGDYGYSRSQERPTPFRHKETNNWGHRGSLAMLKRALEEGEDPLAWVGGEDGGQGAPEKPIEHDEAVDYTNSYSEVPPGAPGQSAPGQTALGRRHPFALGL